MSSARIIDNGYRSDSFFIAISIEFCNIVIEKPSFAVLYEGRRALKRLRTTVFFPPPPVPSRRVEIDQQLSAQRDCYTSSRPSVYYVYCRLVIVP